ncbi:hypothetical protein QEN19_000961 [Hanseniaspora menglaensis]
MILIGPGPGSPTSSEDTGIIFELLQVVSKDLEKYGNVPIFGVCLGFQAICHHLDIAGTKNFIKYLEKPVHGQVARLSLISDTHHIFANTLVNEVDLLGTRYHSIYYDISHANDEILKFKEKNLYYVDPIAETTDGILMAAQISNTSIMGVQYHLESCCSNHGLFVLNNYISEYVLPYYLTRAQWICKEEEEVYLVGEEETFELLSSKKNIKIESFCSQNFKVEAVTQVIAEEEVIDLHLNLIALLKDLFGGCLMLGSLIKQKHRGEFSIFGIPNSNSSYYYYDLNESKVYKDDWGINSNKVTLVENCNRDGYYEFIEKEMQSWQENVNIAALDQEIYKSLPFTGGFLGILNYEMGDCVPKLKNYTHNIGAVFAKIDQAIVWDHFEEKFYFIEVSENTNKIHWKSEAMKSVLKVLEAKIQDKKFSTTSLNTKYPVLNIEKPNYKTYGEQYNKCINYMHQGESYELCLTTQCKVELEKSIDPFNLFCKLSNMNPAPFSSYMSFPKINLNLLSSSPERFIKWNSDLSDIELRPIKGTVSKKKDPTMTFEKATEILKTPKEFGENLMIVDLIRNDLYKLLQKVELKELMTVEEYETVYQLVSVIKGSEKKEQYCNLSGLDILKSSLPPGSMTGAPKIKSVELLQKEIESLNVNERGIYSGVTGFYSLNKKGDWSVNIRCLFSNDSMCWRLGAGGAITVLSDLEGEYEEMKVKLESALQIFQ